MKFTIIEYPFLLKIFAVVLKIFLVACCQERQGNKLIEQIYKEQQKR
ncbi:hypothetical protein RE735_17085 [Bacillus aerius]|nr:hypothetical protein [Bacillus aerius]WMT28764.1 hypothetical protein RE735_17085 [Bacillus aerius]